MQTQAGPTQAQSIARTSPVFGILWRAQGLRKVSASGRKAPGCGVGVALATGRGGGFTCSTDNFKQAILLSSPLLNSST